MEMIQKHCKGENKLNNLVLHYTTASAIKLVTFRLMYISGIQVLLFVTSVHEHLLKITPG